jgi:hypothetical protein
MSWWGILKERAADGLNCRVVEETGNCVQAKLRGLLQTFSEPILG